MSETDASILSAIDQGQFSLAQSLLSRKLKKFPNKNYYWAVNCYLLVSLGKHEEALSQSNALKEKVPSDPHALEMLYKVFELLGRPKDANMIYENAVKKYPSADLIECWFQLAVSKFDIKTMQKAAMALQKHKKGDRKLAMRAAFCCLNLALSKVCKITEKEATLYSNLGEKLLELFDFVSGSTQEVYVYCKLLKNNEKYQEIALLLSSYEGTLDLDLQLLYLDALDKLEKWEELYLLAKKLLFEVQFNDFDTWKYLIRASKNTSRDYVECQDLISLHRPSTRNSQLAAIEAAKLYEKPVDALILNYYKNFSSKLCCYTDISYYQPTPFIDKIKETTSEILASSKVNTASLITLVNNQKFIQTWDDKLDKLAFIAANWAIYHKFQPLLAEKVETDAYSANELILMNVVLSLEDKSASNIVKNIITLEHLLDKDPQDFKVRLLLLHLYASINCDSLAVHNYNKLRIKMFQHESLSHLIVDSMTPTKANLQELINIYRFYLSADGELNESVSLAFEKEVYNKLESFTLFSIKLKNSLSRYVLLLQLIKFCRILNDHQYLNYFSRIVQEHELEVSEGSLDVLDNRDYTTLWSFGSQPNTSKLPTVKRGKEYVQLMCAKELLILENDFTKTTKLIKQFNKALNSEKIHDQLAQHEQWTFKLLLNLFKLFKQPPSKESEALVNFLVKNLKLEKIKLVASGAGLNRCLFEVLEFIKIYEQISRRNGFKSEILLKAVANVAQEIKNSKLTDLTLSEIDNVSADDVPRESATEVVEMIKKSLKESSYKKCI